MTPRPADSHAPQRGAVLILVLVCMLAVASLVLGALDQSFRQAREPALLAKEYRADMLAEAGLAAAVQRIQNRDTLPGADGPLDDWAETWTGPGMTVHIIPCNAYIDLGWLLPGETKAEQQTTTEASKRTQRAVEELLRDAKLPITAAQYLMDWMDKDTDRERLHGSEKSAYSSTGKDYFPRNDALPRPEEALLVREWDDATPEWVREHFTLWGEDEAALNLNFAPEDVIRAFLPELEPYVPSLLHYREKFGLRTPADLMHGDIGVPQEVFLEVDQYVTVSAGTYRVIIDVDRQGWHQRVRCIVNVNETQWELICADVLENWLED